jgi:opacity protein-like surface antigen
LKVKLFLALLFFTFLKTNGQILYPQDGIYSGIESGVALVNMNGTFSNLRVPGENEEFLGEDYTKSVIGVNLGYGRYFGENFLGLEIHHSIYTKKIDEQYTQGNFLFNVNIGSKSEADLIIGRKIGTRSLLTGRIGIALSNINVIADYTAGPGIYVLDKQWNGFSLGMGYVYGINDYLAIKTKYNLTTFRNQKFPETKSKFVDNRFTISVIYNLWSPDY